MFVVPLCYAVMYMLEYQIRMGEKSIVIIPSEICHEANAVLKSVNNDILFWCDFLVSLELLQPDTSPPNISLISCRHHTMRTCPEQQQPTITNGRTEAIHFN